VGQYLAGLRARLFGGTAAGPPAGPSATAPTPPATAPATADGRPQFPVEVFPAKVATFARRVAAAVGCPIDFVGLPILVVSGAAIGAARSLRLKASWHEKPGLYAVIVSRPGTAKTPALKAVMNPIYEEQDSLNEEHKAARKKYEQDLEAYKEARRNRKKNDPEPQRPDEPAPLRHIFVSDTTVESLAANLEENRKGLLCFRDELTAWVRALDMYKGRGTDRQFFLSAWSGEMVKVDRKYAQGKPIVIPHPFVSVLGGIQPDLLTELEADGGKEDGFIHRVLFSYPADLRAAAWTDDEVSEEDERGWGLVLRRLLNLRPDRPEGGSERPRELRLSPDGQAAWKPLHDRIVADMNAEDAPPELFGPSSKLRAHAARFALILHMLRVACGEAGTDQDEGQVDAEDVGRAEKLCAYFQAHLTLVYPRLRQSRQDQMVADLVAWMKRKGLTQVTVREVYKNNVCGIKKASEAEALLKAAADRGLGRAEGDPQRPGRRRVTEVREFVLGEAQ
jgi:hypothetical protein